MVALLPLYLMLLEILLFAVGGWSSHGMDARCSAVFAGAPLTPLSSFSGSPCVGVVFFPSLPFMGVMLFP